MFTKFFSRLLFIGVLFSIISCDPTETSLTVFGEAPVVQNLTIQPNSIVFVPEDGFRDTTLSIYIEAFIENVSEETFFGYTIRNKASQEIVAFGELAAETRADIFRTETGLETTTTSFENYIVEAFAYNEAGIGNFIQVPISIQGFSNNKPEILEVSNPDTLQRPESGETIARFTAKVRDLDGQSSIDRVLIRVINQESGEVTGSPFRMVDSGNSGDLIASDSIFTWALPVTPTDNNPNRNFNIEYFAIDLGGLISDTVKTTFSIKE
ncbi:MAG: hypothetical protein ACMZ7B_10470 [Balneola sp.]